MKRGPFVCALAIAALGLFAPAAGVTAVQLKDDPEHAAALVEAAIAALGGPKYVAVNTAIGTGTYTAFSQGRATVPLPFVDTFIYPDKNRSEFGRKKTRVVQSNSGERGWKYDGARELLSAQEPDEIRAFQQYVRGNIDNVLRRTWRDSGVKVRYLGRVELAPRDWAEGVSIEYPDDFSVDIYFDPQTHLPRLSRYREGAASGAAGSQLETRYHVYLEFGGIMAPRAVDLYRDQVQTARLVYDDVKFNAAVDSKVFDQPASPKELK